MRHRVRFSLNVRFAGFVTVYHGMGVVGVLNRDKSYILVDHGIVDQGAALCRQRPLIMASDRQSADSTTAQLRVAGDAVHDDVRTPVASLFLPSAVHGVCARHGVDLPSGFDQMGSRLNS